MISHKYKCVFIHQRKNAGTSIIRSFGYTPNDSEWHMFNDGTLSENWHLKDFIAPDYLIFTVVRNPWDRFISGWKYLPKYRNLPLDEVMNNLPEEGHDYRHLLRPQLDTLINDRNEYVPHVTLRFENLDDDFRELSRRIGKPLMKDKLEKLNAGYHRGLGEYSHERQIDFVAKCFKKDIDFFSYGSDRPRLPVDPNHTPRNSDCGTHISIPRSRLL